MQIYRATQSKDFDFMAKVTQASCHNAIHCQQCSHHFLIMLRDVSSHYTPYILACTGSSRQKQKKSSVLTMVLLTQRIQSHGFHMYAESCSLVAALHYSNNRFTEYPKIPTQTPMKSSSQNTIAYTPNKSVYLVLFWYSMTIVVIFNVATLSPCESLIGCTSVAFPRNKLERNRKSSIPRNLVCVVFSVFLFPGRATI